MVNPDPYGRNFDEAKVPTYDLPDLLTNQAGEPVCTAGQWQQRREELLELFASHVYGRRLGALPGMTFETIEQTDDALNGKAIRRQVVARFTGRPDGPSMNMLIHVPRTVQPAPVFVGLNFHGNQAVLADAAIHMSTRWTRERPEFGIVNNHATEASRGSNADAWPVEKVIDAGFALVTMYYGDLALDHIDKHRQDVLSLFDDQIDSAAPDRPGAITAWAWGLSRALDYCEQDDGIDAGRAVAVGHSRLGKTALWAGACDTRFAGAISNNSGEVGAALSRRRFGSTPARMNQAHPWWTCPRFKTYDNREDDLPVDQHMLVGLLAPRLVYVASATEDLAADPRGEFLGAWHAEPAYQLHGLGGLLNDQMPPASEPMHGQCVGYHLRPGRHRMTSIDWQWWLAFFGKRLQSSGI